MIISKEPSLLPQFSSVQSLSHIWLFATPWTSACQASLSITNFRSLPKLMSIESVMPSNHLIICHPPLLPPSIFPSIRVFSNESAFLIRWPKYWSFSFNNSSSNEHSVLISFRMDWLDLLAVQGTLKSLVHHHSSKASILLCLAFFIVQLSHPYMTTGKTIALTRQTFVDKVMSLLFNMLSMLVITFLPGSKCLLISWLQSSSAVIYYLSAFIWQGYICEVTTSQHSIWRGIQSLSSQPYICKLNKTCCTLFTIVRTWNQPRCPLADEWIRKLWYLNTMEYYSAIKNNAFESVLMRWMKLKPIIQSEVSQKEKHQYSILMHIYGI